MAGVRDGYREGKYMKFSAVSLYLEDNAVPWLAAKWKGKTAAELEKSDDFVNDLITGKSFVTLSKFFPFMNSWS